MAATLHRLNVDHNASGVLFAGTGLPHTPGVLRKAGVTHPDRLFVLEPIPLTLDYDDARYAVVEPARRAGVVWAPDAAAGCGERHPLARPSRLRLACTCALAGPRRDAERACAPQPKPRSFT